jgi:putative CocE/NonD family hydrolase
MPAPAAAREPLELTGAARLFLWVSSTASDGALFATLEDVTPDGRVIPLTEGQLRALQRQLAEPPQPGAALARSFRRADAQPLIPGEPAELVFDLEPTSYLFAAGHRVRLSLAGAERDHFARVPAAGEVRLRFHRDRLRPSRLELPIWLPER